MTRKSLIVLLLLISAVSVKSQVIEPVSWKFSYVAVSENVFDLVFDAKLEDRWHLYALHVKEGGPIPTSFTFTKSPAFILNEKPYATTEPEVIFDKSFDMEIGMHSERAEFRQKLTVKEYPALIKGYVSFMSCDDKSCLPPRDVDFEIRIEKPGTSVAQSSEIKKENIAAVTEATPPKEKTNQEAKPSTETVQAQTSTVASAADPVQNTPEKKTNKSFLKFFFLSMLAGFAGVLTPCVFPMIPMTVAFFSQGVSNRAASIVKAIVFGISIIIIYSSLGIIVSLTSAGAGFANTLSTHWIPNTIFFLLFIVFASSFFGAFEMGIPNSWVSKSDSKIDKGGMFAAFFMGLTTVLVSFACTGPIVGALLVEAASGDVLRPTIGMFGFGLAFALPFTVFALFPSVMQKMPKSGGWLNSIKVVLGFIMLAFSLKFASVIDNVYSLGILSRDVYLAIWIVIFILLGIYLMGKLKFSNDSDLKHIGIFRLFLIIASFSFALYMVPGLFGAPLKGISALLPPQETSGFNLQKIISENRGSAVQGNMPASNLCETPKYSDFLKFENNLEGYFDLKQGLECAKKLNKPVLIDFKGHACANCKEMDARVWSDPAVQQRIRENFVLVALYVDDRTALPETEWIISKIDKKEKKTMGKLNEDIEISMFNTNTLPFYAIVDFDGNKLVEPRGTDFDIPAYIAWLDKGAEAFNRNKQ
jgi:thiol:disulfide interchange protein